MNVEVNEKPFVDLQSETFRQVCFGDSLFLGVSLEPEIQYQWFRNGASLTQHNSSYYWVNTVGLYHLYAVSSFGCIDSSKKILVNFYEKPEVPIINSPEPQVLVSNVEKNNQWFLNGEILLYDTAQTIRVELPGKYKTRIYAAGECFSESEPWEVSPTGVGEMGKESLSIKLYPNPLRDQCFVDVPLAGLWEVYDVLGKQIVTLTLELGINLLDFSGLLSGRYFIVNQQDRSWRLVFEKI